MLQVQDPFEAFAEILQSARTLKAATCLLQRFAVRVRASSTGGAAGIEKLLKRLFPRAERPDRYPARVFLCAYMILNHPQVASSIFCAHVVHTDQVEHNYRDKGHL